MDWAIFLAKDRLRESLAEFFESEDTERVGQMLAWMWDHVTVGGA